jgi:hypothetical protein
LDRFALLVAWAQQTTEARGAVAKWATLEDQLPEQEAQVQQEAQLP